MAQIKPFRGLRYTEKAGDIDKLCCPPYDIISNDERIEYLKINPCNIIRLELPGDITEGSDPSVYEEAGECLKKWLEDGILANDPAECIYVYEMEFNNLGKRTALTGFTCLVKLEEFSTGIILPHEETLSKAKTDRFNLMKATNCNFSQIYSLYNDEEGAVTDMLGSISTTQPIHEFTDRDGVIHRLWIVRDDVFTSRICELLADKKIYIADGHHRYETALNYRNSQSADCVDCTCAYVPMTLVNMENPGLAVFPTHRIVRGLADFSLSNIITKCEQYFNIQENLTREQSQAALDEAYKNGEKAFALYAGGNKFTHLQLRNADAMQKFMPDASTDLRGLDVSVLHTLVLERIFGIDKENMANQKNLIYTKKSDEGIAAVDSGSANCCFLLNPTRVSELSAVAAAGEKMPQKSTYFWPKLTTGLVMNQIIK